MGTFSDYLGHAKNLPGAARAYVHQNRADYSQTHQNMPGLRDYTNSDAGRAAARHSVGTGISRFLSNSTAKSFRKGNYLMGTLLTFAGHALNTHMTNLKHDQRIFENVARVRRGDPSVGHMTHNELREVRDHAARYGGHDAVHVQNAAHGELGRRQTNKGTDKAQSKIHHDNLVHQNREGRQAAAHETRMKESVALHEQTQQQKAAAHANRIARLRETAGHTSEAKIAHAQHLSNIRKETEAAKTKGVQARQKSIRATVAAKAGGKPATIIKKTAKGAYYKKEGGGQFYQADATKAGHVAKAKAKGGARRRAV